MICTPKPVCSCITKKWPIKREDVLKPRNFWIFQKSTSLNLEEKLWITFILEYSWKALHPFWRKVSSYTNCWNKSSKKIKTFLMYDQDTKNNRNIFLLDPVLADLTLGLSEDDRQCSHWRQMMDQPGERVFVWHTLQYREMV